MSAPPGRPARPAAASSTTGPRSRRSGRTWSNSSHSRRAFCLVAGAIACPARTGVILDLCGTGPPSRTGVAMGLLDGKVALITGGARGQGRAHAVTCAREGADVIVADVAG